MVCLRFSKLFAAQERGNGQYKVEVSRFIPQAKANEDKQNNLSPRLNINYLFFI